MIICQTCRSQQMNGTLFCSECGTDLQAPASPTFDLNNVSGGNAAFGGAAVAQPATPRQSSPSGSAKGSPPPRQVAPPEPAPIAAPGRRNIPMRSNFRMMVLNTGRFIECPYQETVIVGRSDAITGDVPDIDLTPDNAVELGVSRRHAAINFKEEQPFLTDLGSTNRTFLNRQVMMRGQPYELQDGDEVRFGNVIVKVMYNP
jgi:pSer/pThr/pTyr-binding forkhead associated (FHA) protein